MNDMRVLRLSDYSWELLEPEGTRPSPREGHTMVVYQHLLYIFGGWDGQALGDFYCFDTQRNAYSLFSVSGPQVCGHSMTLVRNKLFVFGGYDGTTWSNTLHTAELTDQLDWETPEVVGTPDSRSYHTATLIGSAIVCYAGYNGEFTLGDMVALDTDTLVWSVPYAPPGHCPAPRNAHTLTWCGEQLYLFGGFNGTRDLNEVHVLEPAAFSRFHEDVRSLLTSRVRGDIVLR